MNTQDAEGATALLWAVHAQSAAMVRALIASSADVNLANRYGLTPLIEACKQGSEEIAGLLLDAHADPLRTQPEGETALMAAANTGMTQIVRRLIALGADVNAKETAQDQTALMWASAAGHAEVVRELLKAKADPNAIARPSSLPRVGKLDAGRMWVDHASGGLSTLMFAARQGEMDAARELIKAGANVRYANPDGVTPLMIAVLNDHLELAAMLLDVGADPNDGSLYEAVGVGNLRTNSVAADATRPRPVHADGFTPSQFIEKMLAAGADPSRPAQHTMHIDGTGTPKPVNDSAMHLALVNQDVAVLRLFLAKGADTDKPLPNGQTPLMELMTGRAAFGGFPFGVDPGPRRFPGSHDLKEAAEALLDAGADPKVATSTGDTALHAAAQNGNVAVIRLLADRGAPVAAKDNAGLTPLDIAMGKRPPANNAARGGAGAEGGRPAPVNREAARVLRQLMGLPVEAEVTASAGSAQESR